MKALRSILVASSPALGMLIPPVAFAQESAQIRVSGPGGPAPAMKEAAKAFEKRTGTAVTLTAGPAPEWIANAKADADVIYSDPRIGPVKMAGVIPKFPDREEKRTEPAPEPGQHNREICCDLLGLSAQELSAPAERT